MKLINFDKATWQHGNNFTIAKRIFFFLLFSFADNSMYTVYRIPYMVRIEEHCSMLNPNQILILVHFSKAFYFRLLCVLSTFVWTFPIFTFVFHLLLYLWVLCVPSMDYKRNKSTYTVHTIPLDGTLKQLTVSVIAMLHMNKLYVWMFVQNLCVNISILFVLVDTFTANQNAKSVKWCR